MNNLKIAFFGTPDIAVWVLEELEKGGFLPSLVVTNPDRPVGRKQVMTPPPVKVWAEEHTIDVLQPETLRDSDITETLAEGNFDLFIVAAYGKIIPKEILDLPKHSVLNVHPSLLPQFRGASPIRSAILTDTRETGVTIMELDEQMDHGPIVVQEVTEIAEENWPVKGGELDEGMARHGGALLASIIPEWVAGEITPQEQDHEQATFCEKISKADGELDLSADPYQNLLKIRAFDGWPGTFFFTEKDGKQIRVKITDAKLANDGPLNILRVIPEGKNEMDYEDFLTP